MRFLMTGRLENSPSMGVLAATLMSDGPSGKTVSVALTVPAPLGSSAPVRVVMTVRNGQVIRVWLFVPVG